jgi:general secretion pathway protein G
MNKKGFTLIELLIVVAIIGIIAAIAIPNLLVALQKGKQKATMGDLKTIGSAIESYVTDWSFAPTDDTFVSAALGAAYFEPFYIKICPKFDGWGNHFLYTTPSGDQYTIYSGGRGIQANALLNAGLYDCTRLSDFNLDIAYSNGLFTVGPVVKR